jgi:hypothetical protein
VVKDAPAAPAESGEEGGTMKQLNLTERQLQTDEQGDGGAVQRYLEGEFKEYGVTYVSVVVVGQRYRGTRVEIVYAITVDSKLAIPHALEGKSRTGPTGDRFSYSQLANSVYTSSFSTALTAMYSGSDPPTEPPR